MLYFGIDWSQDHHNLCILNEAGARVSVLQFEHSPTGFAQIEAERRKCDVPARECPVGIETSYNLVVDYLLDYAYPVYLIPRKRPKVIGTDCGAAAPTMMTVTPGYSPASCGRIAISIGGCSPIPR